MSSNIAGAAPLPNTDSAGRDMNLDFDTIPEINQLFISHGDWMRRTHKTFGIRSAELKRLDDAILRADLISFELSMMESDFAQLFHRGHAVDRTSSVREAMEKEAYKIVQRAFDSWAKSEGDWQESRRNTNIAPAQVFIRLLDLQRKYPNLVPDSSEIVTAGSEFTAQIFREAKVQIRGCDFSNMTQSVSQASTISGSLSQLGILRESFERILTPHFGAPLDHVAKDPAMAREIMKVLPNLTTKIHEVLKMLPGVGVATSAISAMAKLYDVHKTDNNRAQLVRTAAALPEGDAKVALGAIKHWQSLYIQDQKMSAMSDISTAAAQLAAIFVPAGHAATSIMGAVKSIAQMMYVMIDLGIQYRDSRTLQNYLRTVKTIDNNIFAISPIVGAYYVLNVPFSVFSLHLIPFESPTFFADTETLRESGEMKAILSDAERILDASKFILTINGRPLRSRESMKTELAAKKWIQEKKARIFG